MVRENSHLLRIGDTGSEEERAVRTSPRGAGGDEVEVILSPAGPS